MVAVLYVESRGSIRVVIDGDELCCAPDWFELLSAVKHADWPPIVRVVEGLR